MRNLNTSSETFRWGGGGAPASISAVAWRRCAGATEASRPRGQATGASRPRGQAAAGQQPGRTGRRPTGENRPSGRTPGRNAGQPLGNASRRRSRFRLHASSQRATGPLTCAISAALTALAQQSRRRTTQQTAQKAINRLWNGYGLPRFSQHVRRSSTGPAHPLHGFCAAPPWAATTQHRHSPSSAALFRLRSTTPHLPNGLQPT